MAKLRGKERAIILAQLAVQIEGQSHHAQWSRNDSIQEAEFMLIAAEDLVAKEYGEFR